MDQEIINAYITLFATLKRKGPGSEESTKRAISLLPKLPDNPDILDIGCGAGPQTLVLAEHLPGSIVATDISSAFLTELRSEAEARGLSDRISTLEASMDNLPFEEKSFDLIWSEGAIFIVGFTEGLKLWRPLLRDSGIIAVSEAAWIKKNPPYAVTSYWESMYPAITTIEENIKQAKNAGYEILSHFVQPATDWSSNFYPALQQRIEQLQGDTIDAALEQVIAMTRKEIDIFHKYGEYYSYVFLLMRKA